MALAREVVNSMGGGSESEVVELMICVEQAGSAFKASESVRELAVACWTLMNRD